MTDSKPFSLFQLLGKAFRCIQREPVVLAPYLILFFTLQAIKPWFSDQVIVMVGVMWVIELFFKGVTVQGFIMLYQGKPLGLRDCLSAVKARYIRLLLSTSLLGLPLLVFGHFSLGANAAASAGNPLVGIVGFLLVVSIAYILEFLPVVVLYENTSWLGAIRHTIRFIRDHFRYVMLFGVLLLSLVFVMLFFSTAFEEIPILGSAVFSIIIRGIVYCLMYGLSVVFYLDFTQKDSQELASDQQD